MQSWDATSLRSDADDDDRASFQEVLDKVLGSVVQKAKSSFWNYTPFFEALRQMYLELDHHLGPVVMSKLQAPG